MFCQYFHLKIKYKVKTSSEVPTIGRYKTVASLIRFWPEIPKAGPRFWVIFPPNPSFYNGAQFDFCRVQYLYRFDVPCRNVMFPILFIRKSSVSMMKISSIIIADDIACQRNQLQHPLQLLNFKTARFWDERLYFCRTAPTDTRKNGRCNLFFLTNSQNRADDFIPLIHPDIISFTKFAIIHTSFLL